jgi:hypothetical protein
MVVAGAIGNDDISGRVDDPVDSEVLGERVPPARSPQGVALTWATRRSRFSRTLSPIP